MWSLHPKARGRCPRILDYADVITAPTVDALFKGRKSLVLFYPSNKQGMDISGHYTAMIRRPDGIDYYDSYGKFPDQPKQYSVSSRMRDSLYAEPGRRNSLIALLKKVDEEGGIVDFSDHKHQSLDPRVATCGRHCLTRCLFPDLSNDEYHALITECGKRWGVCKDDAVSAIWGRKISPEE